MSKHRRHKAKQSKKLIPKLSAAGACLMVVGTPLLMSGPAQAEGAGLFTIAKTASVSTLPKVGDTVTYTIRVEGNPGSPGVIDLEDYLADVQDDSKLIVVDDVRVISGYARSINYADDVLSLRGALDSETNTFVIEYEVTYLGTGNQILSNEACVAPAPTHPTEPTVSTDPTEPSFRAAFTPQAASISSALVDSDCSTVVLKADVPPTTEPTVPPTVEPTVEPTTPPTTEPTGPPTTEPTTEPTVPPTTEPTVEPTTPPTTEPTVPPTTEPTVPPTAEPTTEPTVPPTTEPTVPPTAEPTTEPTVPPTTDPTVEPTTFPTVLPTVPGATTPAVPAETAKAAVVAPGTAPASTQEVLASTGANGATLLGGAGLMGLFAGVGALLMGRRRKNHQH